MRHFWIHTRHTWIVGCAVVAAVHGAVAVSAPTADYAESVAIGAMSVDGAVEISLRLARRPAHDSGTVWLHVATGDGAWSLVDESVTLHDVAGLRHDTPAAPPNAAPITDVHADSARFTAYGTSPVQFVSDARRSARMHGRVRATLQAHPTRHPEDGPGSVPITIDLTFTANGPGARLNNDRRWELFGDVRGTVTIDGRTHDIDLPGKWHEQIGERPSFAPAFTYFNVQGDGIGLLAIRYTAGTAGFALIGDRMHGVRDMTIDAYGPPARAFNVILDDGSTVSGKARVVQTWSVPIEGQRRPGAGVVAETNRGTLVGTLNDWAPDGPARAD
jgi:hypothetical protein